MVSDSCQHVLFLAWTFAVTQLSLKYWWYRIHSSRLKQLHCVLVQPLVPFEIQKWSSSRDQVTAGCDCVHFGVLSSVSCSLAVCILPSAIRSAFLFFLEASSSTLLAKSLRCWENGRVEWCLPISTTKTGGAMGYGCEQLSFWPLGYTMSYKKS